jgi:hypothetical protein
MQLSDYNFTTVTCEKNASSLTLPNTTGFLFVLQFSPVVTLTVPTKDGPLSSRNNNLELIAHSGINKAIRLKQDRSYSTFIV